MDGRLVELLRQDAEVGAVCRAVPAHEHDRVVFAFWVAEFLAEPFPVSRQRGLRSCAIDDWRVGEREFTGHRKVFDTGPQLDGPFSACGFAFGFGTTLSPKIPFGFVCRDRADESVVGTQHRLHGGEAFGGGLRSADVDGAPNGHPGNYDGDQGADGLSLTVSGIDRLGR